MRFWIRFWTRFGTLYFAVDFQVSCTALDQLLPVLLTVSRVANWKEVLWCKHETGTRTRVARVRAEYPTKRDSSSLAPDPENGIWSTFCEQNSRTKKRASWFLPLEPENGFGRLLLWKEFTKKATWLLAPPAWARKWSRNAHSVNIIKCMLSCFAWARKLYQKAPSENRSYEQENVPPGFSRLSPKMFSTHTFYEQNSKMKERVSWLLSPEPENDLRRLILWTAFTKKWTCLLAPLAWIRKWYLKAPSVNTIYNEKNMPHAFSRLGQKMMFTCFFCEDILRRKGRASRLLPYNIKNYLGMFFL